MLMPKQAPPVIRVRGSSGRSPTGYIRASVDVLDDQKVMWKCKKFKVPTVDKDGNPIEVDGSLLAVMIPGEGGGWTQTDIPCGEKTDLHDGVRHPRRQRSGSS